MKKFFRIIFFVAFTTLFLFHSTSKALAAHSCSNFSVSVNGAQITFTGSGCDPGDYVVNVYRISDTSMEDSIQAAQIMTNNSSFSHTTTALESGSFIALLRSGTHRIATANFSVESISPLKCGDPCAPNDHRCPSNCPSIAGANGQWFCGLLCSAAGGKCVTRENCLNTPQNWVDDSYPCRESNNVCCFCCRNPQQPTGFNETINFSSIANWVPGLNKAFRPESSSNVAGIINLVLPYVFIAAGLILLFVLISAGFNMMFGAADEKKVAAAKAQLTNGIIGFVLLFLAYWIVQIVATILGIQVF